MKIIVGERWNQERHPTIERWLRSLLLGEWTPERYVKLMTRLGAFEERAVERLARLGVTWDAAMNLMPPGPQQHAIQMSTMRGVGGLVSPVLEAQYDVVYLAGRRVAESFGLRKVPYNVAYGKLIVVPHPSGLNRMWNEI